MRRVDPLVLTVLGLACAAPSAPVALVSHGDHIEPDVVCPTLGDAVYDPGFRVLWPRCPIPRPFDTLAARCAGAACPHPCRLETDHRSPRRADAPWEQRVRTYTYDPADMLVETTERSDGDSIVSETCTYDAASRPLECRGASGEHRVYSYVGGRLVRRAMTFADRLAADTSYSYDGAGRVIQSHMIGDQGTERDVTYEYRDDFLIRELTTAPAHEVFAFRYDDRGRLLGIDGAGAERLTYDSTGVSARDDGKIHETYHRDAGGRLELVETSELGRPWLRLHYIYECR